MHCADLADLVVWLPPGSMFWRATGGPAALTPVERELREVGYWLRVLDFRERGSKGEPPKRAPEPKWAHERQAATTATNRKAAAYLARQRRNDTG